MTEGTVKSVRRVFEILELFDQERRPLPAKDIARKLGYPLTSAHALLKSMHDLGYADYDPPTWSYVPSPILSTLLDWVRDYLVREAKILDFATALGRETRETINLSRRVNTKVRIIHGLESLHSVGVSVKVGTMMPMTGTLTGVTAFGCLSDQEQADFLENLEENDPDQFAHLNMALLDDLIDELRSKGCVVRCDLYVEGIGALCVPLRTSDGREVLVLGIVGPSDRIRGSADSYRDIVARLVREHDVESVFDIPVPGSG